MILGTVWDQRIPNEILASEFLVLLLSARSVHSEFVREEVRLAREGRSAHGKPLILPIRVDYTGPLGYTLGAWVNPYQGSKWGGPVDTNRVLEEVLVVAEGRGEAPTLAEFVPDSPSPLVDPRRPQPAADLSGIAQPGGALRTDDPFYVERPADSEVRDIAHRLEETVVIQAPRQFGKSSLLRRYLAECRRAGKKTALFDLSLFDDQELVNYPKFLTFLATELIDRLGLQGTATIANQAGMTRFVRDRLLRAMSDNVVLAFDEVDRVIGQPYQSGFFSMLRYWHDMRTDSEQPEWARLELALVISTEPYLLIEDHQRSPFNVRVPIVLEPFNEVHCRELNHRYGRVLTDEQAERLRKELLNGHPFLTRLAYYRLIRPVGLSLDDLLRVADQFDGPFGDHLRALLMKLRRFVKQDLVSVLRQVTISGASPKQDVFIRLQAAGLVRWEGNKVVPANGLYARFFRSLS